MNILVERDVFLYILDNWEFQEFLLLCYPTQGNNSETLYFDLGFWEVENKNFHLYATVVSYLCARTLTMLHSFYSRGK